MLNHSKCTVYKPVHKIAFAVRVRMAAFKTGKRLQAGQKPFLAEG